MRKHEQLEDAIRLIREAGHEPTWEQGRKHIKVRWMQGGHEMVYVLASTPGSHSGIHNGRAQVRRMLRGSSC